jgi:bifunctional DNase/RNase
MSDSGAGQVEVPVTEAAAPETSPPDSSPPDGPVPADSVAEADGLGAESDAEPDDPDESDAEPDEPDDAAEEPAPVAIPPMGDFSMALVSAITMDLPNQHPTVLLRETESPRRQLSFSIGLPDAVALSHALRRIQTPRPLTNELLSDVLRGFEIDVVAVRLVGRRGSVYFAELDLRGRDTRSVLSCRPSDGLCVALLQPVPVPILIDRRLLEEAGDVQPAGSAAPTA